MLPFVVGLGLEQLALRLLQLALRLQQAGREVLAGDGRVPNSADCFLRLGRDDERRLGAWSRAVT